MEVYDFDEKAAEASSMIYRDLTKQGKEINESDILIAGIALSNNEILITRDKGFSSIGENSRIRIVEFCAPDWRAFKLRTYPCIISISDLIFKYQNI